MTERAISVVVCTDGRRESLETTLPALRRLDYQNFELCVVCGPTGDGTLEFVRGLRPEPKFARCPTRNLSRARNLGVALAAGEIVAFLDDDAAPEPEWLADLNAAYDDPAATAAGGVVYDATGIEFQARYVTADRLGYSHRARGRPAANLNLPFSPEYPHLLGANCSFRRGALIELGGFDEEYEYFLDETDMICRIVDAGGGVVQCARAAVHHRCAPSAIRDGGRVVRHWRPLLKNRLYFGCRNGIGHHTPWEVWRAAVDDAESWAREVEARIAAGDLPPSARAEFRAQAESALADGLSAAQAPRRKLMTAAERAAPPPAFRPYPALRAPGARLRLCLVSQDYPPSHNGGVARNVETLARAWARLGHYVDVLTRAAGPPSVAFVDGVWVRRLATTDAEAPPPWIAPLPIPPHLWAWSRAAFREVERLDATRRVDLVYAPVWDAEAIAFVGEPRFPTIAALQTTLEHWLDSYPERRLDLGWMRERGAPGTALERFLFARAPLLHANSRAIVRDIAERYGAAIDARRIVYAPHGLDDWAGGEAGASGGGVRYLFVGRLERRKGIDVLLDAAPEVLRRFPNARIDVVGEELAREDGLAWRDAVGGEPRVVFHGRVGEAELRRRYRETDVLVAPSRYESFGLIYVEGMMHAKPVIGGRAGGADEVIDDERTGLLVPPGDVAALVAAMCRLAGDEPLRRELGSAGRRRYEREFRADDAASRLLDETMARVANEAGLERAS